MYETPELDSDAFVRTHEIRVHEDEEMWEGMRAAGHCASDSAQPGWDAGARDSGFS